MRGQVQLTLDNYFVNKNIDIAYKQYKGNKDKYIIFDVESTQATDYSDNEKLIKRTIIYVRCFSISRSDLETMANQVIEALNEYECVEEGSDIPAEIDADIWGIELEFNKYVY